MWMRMLRLNLLSQKCPHHHWIYARVRFQKEQMGDLLPHSGGLHGSGPLNSVLRGF
jgi:hypothetical protein